MADKNKDRTKDINRLRRILDETKHDQSTQPTTQESKALQSVHRRLHQQQKKRTTPPPATAHLLKDKTDLEPKVTIHPKEKPTPTPPTPKPQTPPTQKTPTEQPTKKPKQPTKKPTTKTRILNLTVEDLYEIEKTTITKPEFKEVKPPQEKTTTLPQPLTTQTTKEPIKESLPDWEPVSEPSTEEKQKPPQEKTPLPEFQPVTRKTSKEPSKKDSEDIPTWEPLTSVAKKEKPLTKKDRKQKQKEQKKEQKKKKKQTKQKQKETQKALKKQKTIKTTPALSVIDEQQLTFLTNIKGINTSTAYLLYTHGYTTLEKLQKATKKDLSKIKGINKKLAKTIITNRDTAPKQEITPKDKELIPKPSKKPYTHAEYILYKREIQTTSGKKRVIHFFSKKEAPDAQPVPLPDGYTVKINKRTGTPYLTKKD